MSTLKNPFLRGYQGLTVQRQLIIGTVGGGPLVRRPLHPFHDHLNDERLFQSACRFCDHYALMLEGTPQSPTLNRRCQHEGTVLDVIHAVMVTESGELTHLGDAQSGEAAQMMVQRLSFDTGHYSQCWEISTAHLCPQSFVYLRNASSRETPSGLLFEVFRLQDDSTFGCKLYATPWHDRALRRVDGINRQQLHQEHLKAGVPHCLVRILHLAALADTRILIFDPDAPELNGLEIYEA